MPNFDCGSYFLSVLAPVKTSTIADPEGRSGTSPVHAVRDALSNLPTAQQTPSSKGQSPFARNLRNHFVRFVVIEDLAYVGRDPVNALLTVLTELILPPALHVNPVVAQKQDHLKNPFLFFCVDFDAASDSPAERDSYLSDLWTSAEPELREIFHNCVGFDAVADAKGFCDWIARCQIETTMPFHDYFPDNVPVKALPELSMVTLAGVWLGSAGLIFLLLHFGLWVAAGCIAIAVKLLAALALAIVPTFYFVKNLGMKAYPPAPDATLPEVLKALYLRNQFTRFAIDRQFDAAGDDADSAQRLYDAFKDFVSIHKPKDASSPTQAPGVAGI